MLRKYLLRHGANIWDKSIRKITTITYENEKKVKTFKITESAGWILENKEDNEDENLKVLYKVIKFKKDETN